MILLVLALLVPNPLALPNDDSPVPKEFVSRDGRFSVQFPKPPVEEKSPDKDGGVMQYQFTVGGDNGALLVSYQDNPKLAGASKEELDRALVAAQERVQQSFRGKLIRSKSISLDKEYPGREFEFEIPQPEGQYRSRSYLVKGRFYQVIVVGKKDFVASKEADRFINSFKLVK